MRLNMFWFLGIEEKKKIKIKSRIKKCRKPRKLIHKRNLVYYKNNLKNFCFVLEIEKFFFSNNIVIVKKDIL